MDNQKFICLFARGMLKDLVEFALHQDFRFVVYNS